jgi:hypothetical protein
MKILHPFFATASDMEPALREIERAIPVAYVQAGVFLDKNVLRYPSVASIPHFGISLKGRIAGADDDYLIVPQGAQIFVEERSQRRGGVKYFIDSRRNQGVTFRPGGMFKNECLISGEAGTPHTDDISLRIWKVFADIFFKDFVKIGLVRVGPEALRLLHQGVRLAQDLKFSRAADLVATNGNGRE